jgi:hypothetical protein
MGFDLGFNYYFDDAFRTSINYSYFGRDLDTNDLSNDGNKDGKVKRICQSIRQRTNSAWDYTTTKNSMVLFMDDTFKASFPGSILLQNTGLKR